MAKSLKSSTTTIDVSTSSAPSAGQVLTATGSTSATWQNPAPGVPSAPPLPENVPKIASTIIRHSHDAEVTISSTSFVLLKTITFPNGIKGTIRVYMDTYSLYGLSQTQFQLRLGDGTVLIDFLKPSPYNWETLLVMDITRTFLPGESIQLWGHVWNNYTSIRNFRVAYDNDPNILVAAIIS